MNEVRDSLLNARKVASRVLREGGFRDRMATARVTHVDPYEIAAWASVPVMRQKMTGLLGAYINEPRPGILVNSDRPKGLMSWTLGHELGHHYLNHGSMQDSENMLHYGSGEALHEREADFFAFGLLAPKWLVNENIRRLGISSNKQLASPLWIYQLSLRLGLSYQATRNALLDLKLLNRENLNRYSKQSPADIKRAILGPDLAATFGMRNDVWLLVDGDLDLIVPGAPHDLYVWHEPSNASAGYAWTLGEASDNGFDICAARPSHLQPDGELVIGGKDRVLAAVVSTDPETNEISAGHKTVTLEERQPWRPQNYSGSPTRLQLSMRPISRGLSPQSLRLHLDAVETIH